jgi:hypothetical protein
MSIGADYPDYQGYANWRGPDLDATDHWALTASNPFSQAGYLTNYQSLMVSILPNGNEGGTLTLNWHTDATLAVGVHEDTWNIPSGVELAMMTPILSNYLTATVTTTSAVSGDTRIVIIPNNVAIPSTRYYAPANTLCKNALNCPASSSAFQVLPQISEGPAFLSFFDITSSTHLSAGIYLVNQDGTIGDYLFLIPAPVTAARQQFNAPAEGIAFQVNNGDTAGHTYSFSVTVDGR